MRKITLFLFFSFAWVAIGFTQTPTIIVERFNSQNATVSLSFLETSLQEALITALERNNATAGKAFQTANARITGTIHGDTERISVAITLKEYPSDSTRITRTLEGSVSDIFNQIIAVAPAFVATVAQTGVGFLSVDSTPPNALIYIDGALAGTAPLEGLRLLEGAYTVEAHKEGYDVRKRTITVRESGGEALEMSLQKTLEQKHHEPYIAILWGLPLQPSVMDSMVYFFAGYGFSYKYLKAQAEIGGTQHPRTATYASGFNETVTLKEHFGITMLNLHASYVPFPAWRYISPSIGVSCGLAFIDYRTPDGAKPRYEAETQSYKTLYSLSAPALGGKVRFDIAPFAWVGGFIEARYTYVAAELEYNEYEGSLFGNRKETIKKISPVHVFSVGAGIAGHF